MQNLDSSEHILVNIPFRAKRVRLSEKNGRFLYWALLFVIVVFDIVLRNLINEYSKYLNSLSTEDYSPYERVISSEVDIILKSLILVGLLFHLSKYALSLLYRDRKAILLPQMISVMQVAILLYIIGILGILLNLLYFENFSGLGTDLEYKINMGVSFYASFTFGFFSYYQAKQVGSTLNFGSFFNRFIVTLVVLSTIEALMWVLYQLASLPFGGIS